MNLPAVQAVEVVNPACTAPARFQLVGFTEAMLPGEGPGAGVIRFSRACANELPNSRRNRAISIGARGPC